MLAIIGEIMKYWYYHPESDSIFLDNRFCKNTELSEEICAEYVFDAPLKQVFKVVGLRPDEHKILILDLESLDGKQKVVARQEEVRDRVDGEPSDYDNETPLGQQYLDGFDDGDLI
jgi:hypothetical protein